MTVAFDTAGGHRAGIGHVIRSLALARRVRALGARVSVVDASAGTSLPETRRAPDVVAVDRPDTSAALLRRHARRWPAARLVVLDYYGEPVDRLASVINLNDSRDRGFGRTDGRYHRGLRYATIRESFSVARRLRRAAPSRVRRIVVGFGGTDPHGWTAAAVTALVAATPSEVAIDVLSGRPLTLPRSPRVTLHVALANPAPLMARADLAIIGGGTMMIESACLGLPAIVVPRTPEETGFARQFARAGAVRLVRVRAGRLPARAVAGHVRALLDDRSERRKMRRAGRALVDGRGIDRVARLIVGAAA